MKDGRMTDFLKENVIFLLGDSKEKTAVLNLHRMNKTEFCHLFTNSPVHYFSKKE